MELPTKAPLLLNQTLALMMLVAAPTMEMRATTQLILETISADRAANATVLFAPCSTHPPSRSAKYATATWTEETSSFIISGSAPLTWLGSVTAAENYDGSK